MSQDTAAIKLLGLIALTGEFPSVALSRLLGDGRYKEKIITDLKAKKFIKLYARDGVRGYRLMLGGKRLLLKENPERFTSILEVLPQARQDLPHRLRQHQMCEALLSMQKAGIPIFHDEKAQLFHRQDEAPTEIVLPAYYTSLEVKSFGPDGTKIKNARFYGILLTKKYIYLVYNAGESLMRWEQKSEIKTRALTHYLLGRELLPNLYAQTEVRGILIGADMEVAKRILCESHKKSSRIFRLDQTFEHLYFVPQNFQGDFMLQMLCCEKLQLSLADVLADGLSPANPNAPIENDGFEADGTPVLFAFDGDVQRLSNFINMLELRQSKGLVICFDFQATAFAAYGKDHIRLQTIDFEKVKRRFFPPKEAMP